MHPQIVFLDRDGVINFESTAYVKTWSEFEFIPGSRKAIRLLTQHNIMVIVITNQSAIHRGLTTLDEVNHIHHMLRQNVSDTHGYITDIFFCPHTPDESCLCRKPRPGMIQQAADKYALDLSRAVMIGDNLTDIQCGQNAGCALTILVKTGNGMQAISQLPTAPVKPDRIATDLLEAVQALISGISLK